MTWSVKIGDSEGNIPDGEWRACDACRHGQFTTEGTRRRPCYIPGVSEVVGPLLTSVDIGADGHMAGGNAVLKCYGYEPIKKEGA